MAAKITHLEILKQALVLLDHGTDAEKEIVRIIQDPALNPYACLGSVAPDVFYFYHVFSSKKNRLAQVWGNFSHHSRVLELVLNFLERIKTEENQDIKNRQLAFVMGYICHCAVDVVTHPFIFYYSGDYYSADASQAQEAQENHLRVEYALDSFLVQDRWGMLPHEYNFIQYVDCREKHKVNGKRNLDQDIWFLWVRGFAEVYPETFEKEYLGNPREILPGDIINESYLGFLKFSRILDTRSRSVRLLLRTLDAATMRKIKARYLILPPKHKIDARLLNNNNETWKYPADPEITSTESFIDLVHRAARSSRQVMSLAWSYLSGDIKLKELEKEYSNYNLDTGLRSESVKMTEFQPLRESEVSPE